MAPEWGSLFAEIWMWVELTCGRTGRQGTGYGLTDGFEWHIGEDELDAHEKGQPWK